MGLGYKAENVRAPQKRTKTTPEGAANATTSVRLYSVTTASQSNALPDTWPGKYIRISAEGADIYYYLTDAAGQTVSSAVTGTADGLSSDGTQLGGIILAGTSRDVIAPHEPPGGNGQIFFVRQGSAAGNARIELASD